MRFILILFCLSISVLFASAQPKLPTKLELVKEIRLKTNNYIGSVNKWIKIGNGYAMLDETLGSVHFFDANFTYTISFDADHCHPGVAFRPVNIIPISDQKIVIASSVLGAYIYSIKDGSCSTREAAKARFLPSPDMAARSNGILVLQYHADFAELLHYDETLTLLNKQEFRGSSEFQIMRSRFEAHQSIIEKDDIIYILNPFAAGIYKVTPNSTSFGTLFPLQLKDFDGPTSDIRKQDSEAGNLLTAFITNMGTNDYVNGIYPISTNYFVTAVVKNKSQSIQVSTCDFSLTSCNELVHLADEMVLNAFDDTLFTVKRVDKENEIFMLKMYYLR